MLFFSQNRQDYYIEIDSLHTFNILSTTVNQDETLTLELDSNSNFEDFLNSQEIYSFEKAYPTAVTPRLQRVYIMKMDDNISMNDFSTRQEVKKFFLIEDNLEDVLDMSTTYDLSSTYYPDDFMDYYEDFPNSDLMLIRAPLAWTITKGNPNLVVGIADTKFDLNHEDLQGKITDNIIVVQSDYYHGTQVASLLVGATNNNKGIASIGYNSRAVTVGGDAYPPGLINSLLVLSQYPDMKVINCSWGLCEDDAFY